MIEAALNILMRRGDKLHTCPQNLVEFQALATRPVAVNGLGLTTQQANDKAHIIESFFTLLPDAPEIYPHWRNLITKYDVQGKQVHDARIVAVMLTYNITHLLTLNPSHFRRFTEITIVEPHTLLPPTP